MGHLYEANWRSIYLSQAFTKCSKKYEIHNIHLYVGNYYSQFYCVDIKAWS